MFCEQGKNRNVLLLFETLQNEMHACERDRQLPAFP